MCLDLTKNRISDSRVPMPYDGIRRGGAPIALAPEVTQPNPGPDVFLDYSSFPVVDLTPLLGGASTGGLRSFNLGAALGLNPGTNWSVNFVSQLIIMDAATGAIAGTDAQPFSVGL